MQNNNIYISTLIGLIMLGGCAAKEVKPKPENFLTLADLSGRVTLKEDSPGVRVIRIKAKAFINRTNPCPSKSFT